MSDRASVVRALVVCYLGASLVACRQIAGIEDQPPVDGITAACGLPYGTMSCAACAATSCCAETQACAGDDSTCGAYEACLGRCRGVASCRSQCGIDHPAGPSADVSALSACLAAHCESECGLSCGAVAPYVSTPASAEACEACVATTPGACAQARACGASTRCDAYVRCYVGCFTPDCRQACSTNNPDGAALFATFGPDPTAPLAYQNGACAKACGAGTNWSCAGQVVWSDPLSPTFTSMTEVVDFGQGSGIPNVTAKYCTGCPCPTSTSQVLASATTDDAGVFTVKVPNVSVGASTDHGLNSCIELDPDPSSGVRPEFAFWGYPVSEPRMVDTNAVERITTMTGAEVTSDLAFFGLTEDPMGAPFLNVLIMDCLGSPASGVSLAIAPSGPGAAPADAGPPEYYWLGSVGSLSATDTDVSGIAGFLNVPAGGYLLTASVGGKAVSRSYINTAAGTLTVALMNPSP